MLLLKKNLECTQYTINTVSAYVMLQCKLNHLGSQGIMFKRPSTKTQEKLGTELRLSKCMLIRSGF